MTQRAGAEGRSEFETTLREQLAALKPLRIELIDDSAKHAGHAGARSGGGHYRLLIVFGTFLRKIDAGASPARL